VRSAPAAVLAALAVGLVGAPPAEACGLPLGAKIPFEQALVSFSGGREEIERPPPAGVRRLLRAPFLTRMERDTLDPSDLRADLVARPVREGGGDGGGPSTAAWLAIGLGGAALIAAAAALAAASVRRRRA